MGTTLTGTTPQDTYDSLIKVTDNGPLSGSLKKLTDGLGNDSSLSLSTVSASLTGASGGRILTLNAPTDGGSLVLETGGAAFADVGSFKAATGTGSATDFYIGTRSGNSLSLATAFTTRLFISSAGNVGIGTSSPAVKLDVVGNIRSSTGILFGSDTAAANALDDYEEGTFTAVLNPATSGTITLSATFNTWAYTKIGRQVTIKGLALVSSVASPIGAEVFISGLPFTILNSNSARGTAAVTYLDQSAGALSVPPNKHSINNTFLDIVIDASTIAANDEFYVTLTYFTA
jgi:hypothetical protein